MSSPASLLEALALKPGVARPRWPAPAAGGAATGAALHRAEPQWRVLCALLLAATRGARYDARARHVLRALAAAYRLAWPQLLAAEVTRAWVLAAAASGDPSSAPGASEASYWAPEFGGGH